MLMNHDYGEALFKTWNPAQREAEIAKLVQGYRAGLPIGILCRMAEGIAGDRAAARDYLLRLMPLEERRAAVEREPSGMRALLEELLL